ncbi:MAG TPA: hypothetical protein VE869_04105 [Gemmatimonas sp.]|nr:hypothetical protein [Gemmatimonas sp.]
MIARAMLQPASRAGLREEIETQVKAAVRAAQDAANEAGQEVTVREGGRHVLVLPDGKRLVVNGNDVHYDGEPPLGIEGMLAPPPYNPNEVPDGVVDIVMTLGATVVLCVVGFPVARAFGRWLDRRGTAPTVPSDLVSRLNGIEQAVETVAVEVERISEGQRFTTKLLNDRATRELAEPMVAGSSTRG